MRARQGFTLIELLVVIAILGILAGVVSFSVFREVDKARVTAAEQQIAQIKVAMQKYCLDVGSPPSNDVGLQALIERPSEENQAKLWGGPYLETDEIPLDPWRRPYIYRTTDSEAVPFEVISYGKDGVEGGEGTNADISSRKLGR
ncbi:MAG: type II secretion system major pseudopilin GspG [Verrucomicrobia bacterium]|nr:type II secretion system major pseudopilin GspG [Verrucomicrobiota bacterium]